MPEWWDKQIYRADELTASAEGSAALLTFYAQLLRAQKDVYDFLRSRQNWLPTGELAHDLTILGQAFPAFAEHIGSHASETLAEEARELQGTAPEKITDLLLNYWRAPLDTNFFGKA